MPEEFDLSNFILFKYPPEESREYLQELELRLKTSEVAAGFYDPWKECNAENLRLVFLTPYSVVYHLDADVAQMDELLLSFRSMFGNSGNIVSPGSYTLSQFDSPVELYCPEEPNLREGLFQEARTAWEKTLSEMDRKWGMHYLTTDNGASGWLVAHGEHATSRMARHCMLYVPPGTAAFSHLLDNYNEFEQNPIDGRDLLCFNFIEHVRNRAQVEAWKGMRYLGNNRYGSTI